MAKTTAKSDRQAKIAQSLKKQRNDEQRRGLVIVLVCVVVAVLIIGAAAFKPIKDWYDQRQYSGKAISDIGAPASACKDPILKQADGNQDHVPQGQTVNYKDAPPAFGAHWNVAGLAPAPMARKLYTSDRPALEVLVHNLEHGYTILWYDKTIAGSSKKMDELRAIADKLGGTTNWRHKFIAAPWKSTDEGGKSFPSGEHVAFTHWSAGGNGNTDPKQQKGVFQYCSDVSGAALNSFMLKYPYTDSPEPQSM